jgi:hypothetical protein
MCFDLREWNITETNHGNGHFKFGGIIVFSDKLENVKILQAITRQEAFRQNTL